MQIDNATITGANRVPLGNGNNDTVTGTKQSSSSSLNRPAVDCVIPKHLIFDASLPDFSHESWLNHRLIVVNAETDGKQCRRSNISLEEWDKLYPSAPQEQQDRRIMQMIQAQIAASPNGNVVAAVAAHNPPANGNLVANQNANAQQPARDWNLPRVRNVEIRGNQRRRLDIDIPEEIWALVTVTYQESVLDQVGVERAEFNGDTSQVNIGAPRNTFINLGVNNGNNNIHLSSALRLAIDHMARYPTVVDFFADAFNEITGEFAAYDNNTRTTIITTLKTTYQITFSDQLSNQVDNRKKFFLCIQVQRGIQVQ